MARRTLHNPSVGDRFGRWTVIAEAEQRRWSDGSNRFRWVALCRCSCGTEQLIARTNLLNGQSTRCRKCQLAENRLRMAADPLAGLTKRIPNLSTDQLLSLKASIADELEWRLVAASTSC